MSKSGITALTASLLAFLAVWLLWPTGQKLDPARATPDSLAGSDQSETTPSLSESGAPEGLVPPKAEAQTGGASLGDRASLLPDAKAAVVRLESGEGASGASISWTAVE